MPVITPHDFVAESREPGDVCGPARTHWISDAAGLTQFGALIEVLEPGSLSSLKHWHSAEDELIYVLDGEVTLIEGETETILRRRCSGVQGWHCDRSSAPQPQRSSDPLPRRRHACACRRDHLSGP